MNLSLPYMFQQDNLGDFGHALTILFMLSFSRVFDKANTFKVSLLTWFVAINAVFTVI